MHLRRKKERNSSNYNFKIFKELRHNIAVIKMMDLNVFVQNHADTSSPDIHTTASGPSSTRHLSRVLANTSPIHAASPQTAQQSIMSMEDDEISDQEIVSLLIIIIYL